MGKHALLSASGAARWLNCTASARFEEQFKKTTSIYAEEGTAAHELSELVTRYWLQELSEVDFENTLAVHQKGPHYSADMYDYAKDYAQLVLDRLALAKEHCPDAFVELESRLDFSQWVPSGFGTGDCVIVADGTLEIIDLKYGKGYRVDAKNNPQMRLYALGVFARYGLLYDIEQVTATIFQPRISTTPSSETLSVEDLLAWADNEVAPKAKAAWDGSGEFCPSEGACKFCAAKQECAARTEANYQLVLDAFDDEPKMKACRITLGEASEILSKAGDIKAWLGDLENLVFEALQNQETVPGWKLVAGRSNRVITDLLTARERLEASEFDRSTYEETKLLTLTNLEKNLGKKVVADVLEGLVIKPEGKPTIAQESDKRPALNLTARVLEGFDE